ncbi:MAG: AMP-binding protein [Terriglobales bacterium]
MSTFYDRFLESAKSWPDHVALEIQRRERLESYSYSDLRKMSEAIGQWLDENGYASSQRIAILADNHPRWVAAFLGIIASGNSAVPLDTAIHADQVAVLLKDSRTSLVFCDSKHIQTALEAIAELPVKIVLTDSPQGNLNSSHRMATSLDTIFSSGSGSFSPVPVSGDSLASLLYTSGTTADPKGVMLTHANLLGEIDAVFSWADIGPDDAVLGVLPLFHVLSQMANLLLPLVNGARVVYLETLNTTELLRALRERQITAFAVVPQFFNLIHERIFKEIAQRGQMARAAVMAMRAITAFSRRFGWNPGKLFFRKVHAIFGERMRYLVTGGSRFDPQIARDFHALGIDVLQAYGLTETTGGAFATSPANNVIGSLGKALKGVEGKIIDPQPEEGRAQPIGEIAIRGPIVMKGYWNRPDATAEVLKDGWLHTGDLGYLDHDSNLFLTGRKKDVIILSNGKNVYPEEIETHYLKSPFIKEICVMGLDVGPGSDKLHAVVVPDFEVLKQRKVVNSKEVIRFDIEGLSAQLASTKRIAGYEIWQDDLPRTTTRKLKRFEIEKLVRANRGRNQDPDAVRPLAALSTEDTGWLNEPNVEAAISIIKRSSKSAVGNVQPSDNLELDLGLDSMQRIELLVELEQQLGGDVPESRLAEIYTVRELVDEVLASAGRDRTGSRSQFAGWSAVLREDPPEAERQTLDNPPYFAERAAFAATRIIKAFSRLAFRLQIDGLDNIPAQGPYILCSNHQSYLDPVVLCSAFNWKAFRQLFAVGTSDIFGSGIMRHVARWLRVIVVDPDSNLISAMRAGAYGLRTGRVLILYPEGERTIEGTPKTFKKGAAILSIHLQVPIVPVAIEGFYQAWPRGKRFQRFAPLRMTIGEPINPPPQNQASESAYEELTAELKSRIVSMWKQLRDKA